EFRTGHGSGRGASVIDAASEDVVEEAEVVSMAVLVKIGDEVVSVLSNKGSSEIIDEGQKLQL
ncbi:hypothetical protein PIB30_104939, partial [Stylosanthes scabra]|nr:hypothetical protein [Stylosanthes scabra]